MIRMRNFDCISKGYEPKWNVDKQQQQQIMIFTKCHLSTFTNVFYIDFLMISCSFLNLTNTQQFLPVQHPHQKPRKKK